MTFLLDSSVVIHYFRHEERIVSSVQTRRNEGLAVSAISIGELYEGIFLSTNPTASREVLNDFLSLVDVLAVDEEVGVIFGRERARLRRAGTPMGDLDLLIASTALRYGLILLTSDHDFERIEDLQMVFL